MSVKLKDLVQMFSDRVLILDKFAKLQKTEPCPSDSLFSIAMSPDNVYLNRYCNVFPYNSNLVQISPHGSYINASYMGATPLAPHWPLGDSTHCKFSPKSYIVTQSPLSETVGDFWDMVYQSRAALVVMLNRPNEYRCTRYWSASEHDRFTTPNGVCVKQTSPGKKTGDYMERVFELQPKGGGSHSSSNEEVFSQITGFSSSAASSTSVRRVTHLHFTSWPDYGVPTVNSFHQLLSRARDLVPMRRSPSIPSEESSVGGVDMIVHCTAGLGRSGTFILSDLCLDWIYEMCQPQQPLTATTFATVPDTELLLRNMRSQRHGMIQTEDQFLFSNLYISSVLEQRI